jgi:hypothetical protein
VAGEWIGHDAAHAAADLVNDLIEESQAAFALKALEEGGDEDTLVVLVGELLEEIASALEDAEAAPDASFEPQGIVESWAVTAVFGAVEKFEKRLEEFRSDD